MTEKLRKIVMNYCEEKGFKVETDDDLIEVITEAKTVHSEIVNSHRWYDETWNVVNINGWLIGYPGFYTTGDTHFSDMGLEYNLGNFVECRAVEKTVIDYEPIKED